MRDHKISVRLDASEIRALSVIPGDSDSAKIRNLLHQSILVDAVAQQINKASDVINYQLISLITDLRQHISSETNVLLDKINSNISISHDKIGDQKNSFDKNTLPPFASDTHDYEYRKLYREAQSAIKQLWQIYEKGSKS